MKDPALFKQEYPASAAEAFEMTGRDSFIPPALIEKARKANCEASGPLVIGYDPAWMGGDRHSMAWRRGLRVIKVESRMKLDTVHAAGWIRSVIETEKPAKVFIDVGWVGAGVYDQLKTLGLPYLTSSSRRLELRLLAVHAAPARRGGMPYGGPLNRRAEM